MVLLEWVVLWPPQDAEYEMFRLPLRAPLVGGAKETDKPALCCGDNVKGRVGPTNAKPRPETAA